MQKVIKKWGDSLVIVFSREDITINPKIKVGNIVILEKIKILEKGDEEN